MTIRVALVRPWTDAHGGGGCCGGDAMEGICFEGRVDEPREHDREALLVGEVFRRLRDEYPEIDVQIVSASNTAYLIPWTFTSALQRGGLLAAFRAANRATTPGAVLVDGERIGSLAELGIEGVLREVRRRTAGMVKH